MMQSFCDSKNQKPWDFGFLTRDLYKWPLWITRMGTKINKLTNLKSPPLSLPAQLNGIGWSVSILQPTGWMWSNIQGVLYDSNPKECTNGIFSRRGILGWCEVNNFSKLSMFPQKISYQIWFSRKIGSRDFFWSLSSSVRTPHPEQKQLA